MPESYTDPMWSILGLSQAELDEPSILSKFTQEEKESPKMLEALKPGDIIRFEYSYFQDKKRYGFTRLRRSWGERWGKEARGRWTNTSRLGIVVKSRRTTRGTFISTKGNLLLNIFLIENVSEDILRIVFQTKNTRNFSYYNYPVVLNHLFGSDNFRTFKFSGVSDIFHMSPDFTKLGNQGVQEESRRRKDIKIQNTRTTQRKSYPRYARSDIIQPPWDR